MKINKEDWLEGIQEFWSSTTPKSHKETKLEKDVKTQDIEKAIWLLQRYLKSLNNEEKL